MTNSPDSTVHEAELVRERSAVRAILITPEHEVLLMRIRPPDRADTFWITPGGGLEPGETDHAALRRELAEELGLSGFDVGPLVWLRQDTFLWAGRRIRQSERYYIVSIKRFAPRMSDPIEAQALQEFRWWSTHALSAPDEPVVPFSLAKIVGDYLQKGAPQEPLMLEQLVNGAPAT